MTQNKERILQNLIDTHIDSSFILHSRVHKMPKSPLYIKRDDELGIMGSKIRKYASILPFLQKKKTCVALVGSAYSNHILSFIQLLKQSSISYKLFLEKPHSKKIEGNFFYLSLLTLKEEIIWLDHLPSNLSIEWKKDQEDKIGMPLFFIPLGGCMKEGLIGGLTLPLDLLSNERALNTQFDHIFIDVGTGLTAAAFLLGWRFLEKTTPITFVLMAGTIEEFQRTLNFFYNDLQDFCQHEIADLGEYECIFPITSKSFGSCNKTIIKTIQKVATEEGIFLDPLYSSKLYITALEKQKDLISKDKILWIHSGGVLSLSGFQEILLKQ
jgi:1-aminocyclopropane-1-carboxylate deaminase/D-cysteine desulfhydrase-like pyridoxal-dependent ACC family enzyme